MTVDVRLSCYNVLREALERKALAKLEELMRLDIEPSLVESTSQRVCCRG